MGRVKLRQPNVSTIRFIGDNAERRDLMHLARMRKHSDPRREFSPEAFGDFDLVAPEKIAELRTRMAARMADQEWETIEDIAENCDA